MSYLIGFIGTLGTWEIILIILIILLIFGGKKLPELARGLGKGVKEFQKAKDEIEDSLKDSDQKSKGDKKEE